MSINELLKVCIKQVEKAGITPGNINPNVKINTRAKGRLGRCSRKPNGKYGYEIELSNELLKADEKAIMMVLVHEILHSCRGCMNHGALWRSYAEKMNTMFGYNIKRTVSHEEIGIARPKGKYVIQCVDCKYEIYRQRKSKLTTHTNIFFCGKCRGKLKLM